MISHCLMVPKPFSSAVSILAVVSASMIITGCGNSAGKIENEKAKDEATTLYNVEKKALDQNRYLNADEVKKVTQSFDKIAASASPEEAKKLRAMTESVTSYRSKLEAFKALGGARVETLKSRADLDNRIAMVDDLSKKSKQVEAACSASDPDPSNLRTLDLEQQLLAKIRQQLLFYKAHYGKWQVRTSGPTSFDVTAAELGEFNKLAADIRTLGAQQMQVMKKNTEERLGKLKESK